MMMMMIIIIISDTSKSPSSSQSADLISLAEKGKVGSSSASSSCSTTSGEEEQQKEKALRHRDGRGGNGAAYRKLPLQCSVDTMDEETQENAHSTTEHFTDTTNNQDVRSTSHVHKLDEFVFLHNHTD
jgi:hypothetical protein